MSRQVRHRVTAMVLGGFLLGAAVVTTGTANAEQIEAGGRQVVFGGGGMLGLSCRSTPSIESMTVPAESTVRVVNRTGHGAKLLLNGASKGTLPENGTTEVVFRRGTTAVTLDPNCAVADQAMPMMVTATPSTPALPDPEPEPSEDDIEVPAVPSDPGTPPTSAPGSVASGTGSPPVAPQRPARPGRDRPAPRPAVTGESAATRHSVPSLPQGGLAHHRPKSKIMRGTPGVADQAPAFAGMPPGDDQALLSSVPPVELPPVVVSASTPEAVPAAEAGTVRPVADAERVAAMTPLPEPRPVGLLAVVAAVCVLGVGAASIRAFVSQRASRANIA